MEEGMKEYARRVGIPEKYMDMLEGNNWNHVPNRYVVLWTAEQQRRDAIEQRRIEQESFAMMKRGAQP